MGQGELFTSVCQSDAFERGFNAEKRVGDRQIPLTSYSTIITYLELPFMNSAGAGKAEANAVMTHEVIRVTKGGLSAQVLR